MTHQQVQPAASSVRDGILATIIDVEALAAGVAAPGAAISKATPAATRTSPASPGSSSQRWSER